MDCNRASIIVKDVSPGQFMSPIIIKMPGIKASSSMMSDNSSKNAQVGAEDEDRHNAIIFILAALNDSLNISLS